jgi:hypothetical protein
MIISSGEQSSIDSAGGPKLSFSRRRHRYRRRQRETAAAPDGKIVAELQQRGKGAFGYGLAMAKP